MNRFLERMKEKARKLVERSKRTAQTREEVSCDLCKGQGMSEGCESCGGRGVCPSCNGSGNAICPKCHGEGGWPEITMELG